MENVYKKVAPDKTITKFHADMEKKGITPKPVKSHWPYDYDEDFKAYEVEFNDKTFYFCFGSEGQLLQKKII